MIYEFSSVLKTHVKCCRQIRSATIVASPASKVSCKVNCLWQEMARALGMFGKAQRQAQQSQVAVRCS